LHGSTILAAERAERDHAGEPGGALSTPARCLIDRDIEAAGGEVLLTGYPSDAGSGSRRDL